MATDTQEIDLVLLQQALICRTVWCMADCAAFDFRFVLINEWPLLFSVAFVADVVAGSVGPQLFRSKTPMWAMTIAALN